MVLSVAVASSRRPFTSVNPCREGQAAFSGVLVQLLPDLLTAAGFNGSSIEFYTPPPQSQGGGLQRPDGTWTGMIGELTSRRADIALTQLTATSYREAYVDQTFSVIDAKMALMVHADTLRPTDAFTFLQPFSWQLWVCLVLMTFGMAMVLTVLARLSTMGLFDIRKVTTHMRGKAQDMRQYAVHDITKSFLLDTWMTATGQTPVPRGRSWAIKMVSITYGLFSLIVIASYVAAFAAILSLKTYGFSAENMQDLADRNLKFGIDAGGVTQHYFEHPHDQLTRELSDQWVPFSTLDEGIAAIRRKDIAGYVTQQSLLDYTVSLQPCDMAIVDKGFGYGSQGKLVQRKLSQHQLPDHKLVVQACVALRISQSSSTDPRDLPSHLSYSALPAQISDAPPWAEVPDTCSGSLYALIARESSKTGLWFMLFMCWGLAALVTAVERFIIWIGHRSPQLRRANARVSQTFFGVGRKHFDFKHADEVFGTVDGSAHGAPRT